MTLRNPDSNPVDVILGWWGWPALYRWRFLIIGGALLAALVAFAYGTISARLSPRYESTASILVSAPAVNIQLDPKFTTQPSVPDLNSPAAALARRMDTFVALARSREVADLAAKDLQAAPQWHGVTGQDLLDHYRLVVKPRGELLDITAQAAAPEVAEAVASAWARALVARGSSLFLPNVEGQAALEATHRDVQAAYDKASADLAAFERSSKRKELEFQIADGEQQVRTLRARQDELEAILAEARILRSRVEVQGPDSLAIRQGLQGLYVRLRNFDATAAALAPARGLGAGTADRPSPGILIPAEAQAGVEPPADTVAALDDLIALVIARIGAGPGPAVGGATGVKGNAQQLRELEDQLRDLRAQYEKEVGEYTRLTGSREALRQSLQSIENKLAESRLSSGVGQGQATVAVDATRATSANSISQTLLMALLAAAVTLFVLSAFALVSAQLPRVSMRRLEDGTVALDLRDSNASASRPLR